MSNPINKFAEIIFVISGCCAGLFLCAALLVSATKENDRSNELQIACLQGGGSWENQTCQQVKK